MKKNLFKVCVFILTIMCFYTALSVDATGYTYDHNGKVIDSTEGFTVNETPYIYSSLGIASKDQFTSPSDLFVYTKDKTNDPETPYRTILYLLDAGDATKKTASTLFLLDTDLKVFSTVDTLILDPNNYTDAQLLAIKSNGSLLLDLKKTVVTTDDEGKETSTEVPVYSSIEDIRSHDTIEIKMNNASAVTRMYKTNSLPYTDYLYICDTGNNQILVLDNDSFDSENSTYDVVQVVTSPVDELGTTAFSPTKAAVDDAGRIYCTINGESNGIMQFSQDGTFARYIGTNKVTLSAWDIFWRNFSTEAQLSQQKSILPTNFTSITYKNQMIYTTSNAYTDTNSVKVATEMIKKINLSGDDAARRNGYNVPMGDVLYQVSKDTYGSYGPSTFVGITVNDYGVYTVVDSNRGRLFTYDNEGNLLYISGGTGSQFDKISNMPVAVQYLGENILVLDYTRKAILLFEPTDIAKVINKAVECEYEGRSEGYYDAEGNYVEGAFDYWVQVVDLNANYEFAYIGIGEHYNKLGQYKVAMEYFQLGYDAENYGKAYKQYRDGIIKKWFPTVFIVVLVTIVGLVIYNAIRRKKLGIKKEEDTGMGDE